MKCKNCKSIMERTSIAVDGNNKVIFEEYVCKCGTKLTVK